MLLESPRRVYKAPKGKFSCKGLVSALYRRILKCCCSCCLLTNHWIEQAVYNGLANLVLFLFDYKTLSHLRVGVMSQQILNKAGLKCIGCYQFAGKCVLDCKKKRSAKSAVRKAQCKWWYA